MLKDFGFRFVFRDVFVIRLISILSPPFLRCTRPVTPFVFWLFGILVMNRSDFVYFCTSLFNFLWAQQSIFVSLSSLLMPASFDEVDVTVLKFWLYYLTVASVFNIRRNAGRRQTIALHSFSFLLSMFIRWLLACHAGEWRSSFCQ